MNNLLWLFIFSVFGLSGYAFAGEAEMTLFSQVLGFIQPMLEAAAGKYGVIVKIISVIGIARVVFKPVMSTIQAVIGLTPSVKDDEMLAKIMNSTAYKMVAYFLDWTLSIKLPQVPKV